MSAWMHRGLLIITLLFAIVNGTLLHVGCKEVATPRSGKKYCEDEPGYPVAFAALDSHNDKSFGVFSSASILPSVQDGGYSTASYTDLCNDPILPVRSFNIGSSNVQTYTELHFPVPGSSISNPRGSIMSVTTEYLSNTNTIYVTHSRSSGPHSYLGREGSKYHRIDCADYVKNKNAYYDLLERELYRYAGSAIGKERVLADVYKENRRHVLESVISEYACKNYSSNKPDLGNNIECSRLFADISEYVGAVRPDLDVSYDSADKSHSCESRSKLVANSDGNGFYVVDFTVTPQQPLLSNGINIYEVWHDGGNNSITLRTSLYTRKYAVKDLQQPVFLGPSYDGRQWVDSIVTLKRIGPDVPCTKDEILRRMGHWSSPLAGREFAEHIEKAPHSYLTDTADAVESNLSKDVYNGIHEEFVRKVLGMCTPVVPVASASGTSGGQSASSKSSALSGANTTPTKSGQCASVPFLVPPRFVGGSQGAIDFASTPLILSINPSNTSGVSNIASFLVHNAPNDPSAVVASLVYHDCASKSIRIAANCYKPGRTDNHPSYNRVTAEELTHNSSAKCKAGAKCVNEVDEKFDSFLKRYTEFLEECIPEGGSLSLNDRDTIIGISKLIS